MTSLARFSTCAAAILLFAATAFAATGLHPEDWLGLASLILAVLAVFVGGGFAIAVALIGSRSGHPSLPALVVLALAVAAFVSFGLLIDPLDAEGQYGGVYRALSAGIGIAAVLVGVALSRLSVTFPRVLHLEALEAVQSRWAETWRERRQAGVDANPFVGPLDRGVAWVVGRLMKPGPLRDDLLRLLDPDTPPALSSWLGLPWSAWRWAAVVLPVVVVTAAVFPEPVPVLIAAITFVILGVHGILYFILGYATLDSREKGRARWLSVALLLPCALPTISFGVSLGLTGVGRLLTLAGMSGATATTFAGLAVFASWLLIAAIPLVIPVGLSIAVFWDGAIDPDLVVRKSVVFGTIGILFLFLLAGLGNAAEGFLESLVGLPPFAGTVVTGGTIAVVLIPVKRRMDRFMNRIFPATVLAEAPTQTVAILFSDLVGYTALTGADQRAGLTVMSVFHKAADRVARENRGRFVKAVADEVMLEFKEPSNAVRAASQLQDEFHEAAKKLDLPTPDICTGIHYGEATRSSEGDLFGDAVNIASRVQGVAEAGQVVLSGVVRQQLDEGEFELESLGPRELKNVAEPVEIFALL